MDTVSVAMIVAKLHPYINIHVDIGLSVTMCMSNKQGTDILLCY